MFGEADVPTAGMLIRPPAGMRPGQLLLQAWCRASPPKLLARSPTEIVAAPQAGSWNFRGSSRLRGSRGEVAATLLVDHPEGALPAAARVNLVPGIRNGWFRWWTHCPS